MEKQKTCQGHKKDGSHCLRPLYDDTHCIFHSRDIEGKKRKFFITFKKELERQKETEEIYDFSEFVFPDSISFDKLKFEKNVFFNEARFYGKKTDFKWTEFLGETTDFFRAKFFGNETNFSETKFKGKTVNFTESKFSAKKTNFVYTTFSAEDIIFMNAKFTGHIYFYGTSFNAERINFLESKFYANKVDFVGVKFRGELCDFRECFGSTKFGQMRAFLKLQIMCNNLKLGGMHDNREKVQGFV